MDGSGNVGRSSKGLSRSIRSPPSDGRDLLDSYLSRVAAGSRRSIRQALDVVARAVAGPGATASSVSWHLIAAEAWQGAETTLRQTYSGTTVRKFVSALRGILRIAREAGLISAAALEAAVPRGRRLAESGAHPRCVSTAELDRLFRSCLRDPTPAGCRDAVAVALLYAAGLRRAELVRLDVRDYHLRSRVLTIPGPPRRKTAASTGVHGAIQSWLEHRGSAAGPLLCPIDKRGRVSIRRISDQALYNIVRRRAHLAKLRSLTPNDLKRTFKVQTTASVRSSSPVETMLQVPFQGCGALR